MIKLDLAKIANTHRETKSKNNGNLICTLFVCGMFALSTPLIIRAGQEFANRELVKSEEVYMICDVAGQITVPDYDETILFVRLPDGSIQQFYEQEIPDEVSEVVIRTEFIDYVDTYEIVGLR